MRHFFSFLFLFFISINIKAQLMEPILSDTMTLSQARYELQREMATINYYYWQDYYGQKLSDRFRYHKTFERRERESFDLLPPDTILQKINERKWSLSLSHTNSGKGSRFFVYNGLRGHEFNKAKLSIPRQVKSSYVFKKVFYYGSTESDPQVLKTDRWYKNRKHIDSVLVDVTFYYPIEMKSVYISATVAEKKDHEDGGFVWLISNDGKFMDVAATDDIVTNLASINGMTEDGIRYDHSRNTYTPEQPSTEMFSYANKCYSYCQQLIQNIDDGKYRSIKDLIKDFDNTRPTPPKIKWVYRYAFTHRDDIKSIEFNYFTKYDSVTVQNVMVYDLIPRKGDYVIVGESDKELDQYYRGIADKDGNWIIKPNPKTIIIDDVAGIFFKINDHVDHSKKSDKLVYVDEKKKQFVEPNFELKKNVNDTVLIVGKGDLIGAVHRSGKSLLPITFNSIKYSKDWRLFIAKLNTEQPQYQLYHADGKLALPKTYRLIELRGDRLYTTEIENDVEKIEVYDKKTETNKERI